MSREHRRPHAARIPAGAVLLDRRQPKPDLRRFRITIEGSTDGAGIVITGIRVDGDVTALEVNGILAQVRVGSPIQQAPEPATETSSDSGA